MATATKAAPAKKATSASTRSTRPTSNAGTSMTAKELAGLVWAYIVAHWASITIATALILFTLMVVRPHAEEVLQDAAEAATQDKISSVEQSLIDLEKESVEAGKDRAKLEGKLENIQFMQQTILSEIRSLAAR